MNYPEDLRYAENHEWVRVDGNTVRMGISDYAQDALGDVVFVELPEVGRKVTAGEAFAEIESTKSVSDVYAPLSGPVVEVNPALEDPPDLVNSDPYGEGWLMKVKLSAPEEIEGLLTAADYQAYVEGGEQ